MGEADVYILNFRPGFAGQIDASEAWLRELNDSPIYCPINGFSAGGPYAARPSCGTLAQAASGFLRLLINPANSRVVGPAMTDAVTGLNATLEVLGALVESGSKASKASKASKRHRRTQREGLAVAIKRPESFADPRVVSRESRIDNQATPIRCWAQCPRRSGEKSVAAGRAGWPESSYTLKLSRGVEQPGSSLGS